MEIQNMALIHHVFPLWKKKVNILIWWFLLRWMFCFNLLGSGTASLTGILCSMVLFWFCLLLGFFFSQRKTAKLCSQDGEMPSWGRVIQRRWPFWAIVWTFQVQIIVLILFFSLLPFLLYHWTVVCIEVSIIRLCPV